MKSEENGTDDFVFNRAFMAAKRSLISEGIDVGIEMIFHDGEETYHIKDIGSSSND